MNGRVTGRYTMAGEEKYHLEKLKRIKRQKRVKRAITIIGVILIGSASVSIAYDTIDAYIKNREREAKSNKVFTAGDIIKQAEFQNRVESEKKLGDSIDVIDEYNSHFNDIIGEALRYVGTRGNNMDNKSLAKAFLNTLENEYKNGDSNRNIHTKLFFKAINEHVIPKIIYDTLQNSNAELPDDYTKIKVEALGGRDNDVLIYYTKAYELDGHEFKHTVLDTRDSKNLCPENLRKLINLTSLANVRDSDINSYSKDRMEKVLRNLAYVGIEIAYNGYSYNGYSNNGIKFDGIREKDGINGKIVYENAIDQLYADREKTISNFLNGIEK